ncbi:MAG: hypothetical protein QM650_02165 [Microlunatus sp.]
MTKSGTSLGLEVTTTPGRRLPLSGVESPGWWWRGHRGRRLRCVAGRLPACRDGYTADSGAHRHHDYQPIPD